MNEVEKELLQAIHTVEIKVTDAISDVNTKVSALETKIDDSVSGRFKDNERRIALLESNQRWVVMAIIGSVVLAVLNLVIR